MLPLHLFRQPLGGGATLADANGACRQTGRQHHRKEAESDLDIVHDFASISASPRLPSDKGASSKLANARDGSQWKERPYLMPASEW
jgi:hypothetical protein